MSIFALLLTIIVGLCSLIFYGLWRRMHYWQRHRIPHDAPHPIYGNLADYERTRSMADIVRKIYLKYRNTAPFCGFYHYMRPTVMVLDLELAKRVLIKDFSNFTDRGLFYNERDDPLSATLFRVDGHKWRGLRNKLSPTFTSGKMKFMFPTVRDVAQRLEKLLEKHLAVDGTTILELRDIMGRYTTDVIGQCAFGIECNSLRDPDAEFRVMGRRIFTDERHGLLGQHLIRSSPRLARMLRMRLMHSAVHDFIMRVVRENVAYRQQHQLKGNDFMQLLMELNKEKRIKDENDEQYALKIDEMAPHVFSFFLAGFVTSASTMSFILYELALHEELQQRVRKEIVEVLMKHNGEFTYECMEELRYTRQVITETLRKYPILPIIQRRALADYTVDGKADQKFVIRKGVFVNIPAIGIHYDPALYPDPERFDPERFAPEKVEQRDSIEWLGFGDGPRICIGARFALMQIRIGLTFLLKNYKFSICERTEIPLVLGKSFIVTPANGVHLKVERV